MTLLIILFCIILLVLLVSWAKVNPFVAFLIVSLAAGLMLGIPIDKVTESVQNGLGDTFKKISIIICVGAMIGKLVATSGAAQKIAEVLVNGFGIKYIQWALVVVGFIIGIPLFFETGFVLMVPLIFPSGVQVQIESGLYRLAYAGCAIGNAWLFAAAPLPFGTCCDFSCQYR